MESAVFTEGKIGPLALRNRTIRSAAFEGMCPDGRPSQMLVDYHESVAAGGIGMTTVAYVSVSPGGRTFSHQAWMSEEVMRDFTRLTGAVHRHGAAAAVQLGHAGYMADGKVCGEKPVAPSRVFNMYGLAMPRAMTAADMDTMVGDFARSAVRAREAGFDCIEVQAGHGYLLSQFLSPVTNRRKDEYGGALENRARLMVRVVRAVKDAAGPGIAVIAKTNVEDGFAGGVTVDEAIGIAAMLEGAGADGLVLSGGFVSKNPMFLMRGEIPLRELVEVQPVVNKVGLVLFGRFFVKKYEFEPAFFRGYVAGIKKRVGIPLVLVGGINSLDAMEAAIASGCEFVALARALIREPDFIKKLEAGATRESKCTPCNKCMAYMYNGPMRCPELEKEIGG